MHANACKPALRRIIEESIALLSKAGSKEFRKARLHLIDIVSVAAAGYRIDSKPSYLYHSLGECSVGTSTIMGLWKKATVLQAALVNSFSAHVLELDDWLPEGFAHVGASIIPCVIATGESLGCSLEEALEAIILGYEVAGRIGWFLGRRHYRRWHTTSTAGGIASAVAVGYLRGLEVEGLIKAAATASAYASGIWGIIGREVAVKPLSAMHAAFLGITSPTLTDYISETVDDALDSERGLCNVMDAECKEDSLNPSWSFAINRAGHKIFPACRNSHTVIQASISLHGKVEPDDIKKIVIEVFEEAYQVADIRFPLTVEEAKFSLSYLASIGLLWGWVGLSELKRGLRDPRIRRLESMTEIRVREDFTEEYPVKQPARVVVELRNGDVLEAYEDTPIGDSSHPLSEENLLRKAVALSRDAQDPRLRNVIEEIKNASLHTSITDML